MTTPASIGRTRSRHGGFSSATIAVAMTLVNGNRIMHYHPSREWASRMQECEYAERYIESQTYGDERRLKHRELWEDAMANEPHGLTSKRTFTVAVMPAGRRPLGAKWVHKLKMEHFGMVLRSDWWQRASARSLVLTVAKTLVPTPAAASSTRLLVAIAL